MWEVAIQDIIWDEITQTWQEAGIRLFDAEKVIPHSEYAEIFFKTPEGKVRRLLIPWSNIIYLEDFIED